MCLKSVVVGNIDIQRSLTRWVEGLDQSELVLIVFCFSKWFSLKCTLWGAHDYTRYLHRYRLL